MTAITVLSTFVCITVVALPLLGELRRIYDDRRNPMRRLRVATRRHQVREASSSGSFA